MQAQVNELDERLAAHDQSDFEGLAAITAERQQVQDQADELESRWLELAEITG